MIGISLNRRLGLFPATNIVIANMIGAGIFTTSGLLLADLHNPLLMLILWIAGGLLALCGALSYGELGASMPEAGGEYLFLSKIFHPIFGFLSGWISFIVGFSAPIAASAIGASEYFTRAFPELNEFLIKHLHFSSLGIIMMLSVIIVVSFTLIHKSGIELGARVQNILTVFKVLLIICLISAGLFMGKGDLSNFTDSKDLVPDNVNFKTIGLSLMWIMFAYSGWNASTYIGSEIRNPTKNLPVSLLLGTGIVILLYFLLNLVFIYAIPPDQMKGVISVGGLAMGNLFGRSAERLFSLLISFALFSSLSAFVIIGPRVYYSMAKDGLFFRSMAKVHTITKVPSRAIVFQGVIAIIFILSGTFEQILTYMGFSLGIFPILTVLGAVKQRLMGKNKVKLPGFPITHFIYILVGLSILLFAFMERPLESGIALVTLLAGLPAYFIFKKLSKTKGS